MIETLVEERTTDIMGVSAVAVATDWRAMLRADLDGAFRRGAGKWSRALVAMGWIHLACFMACQALHDPARERDPRHLVLWATELVAMLAALRLIAGPRWARSSTAVGVATRLWGTFLILSFNLVMLNALTGWETRWYKPAWGTLSTFLLASTAWLFSPRMFIPAVQMYFTALLMVTFKDQENLIYGVSWWLAFLGIARGVRHRELRGKEAEKEPLQDLIADSGRLGSF